MNRNTLRRLSLLVLLALTVMVGGVLADSGVVGQALLAPVVNDAVGCTSVVNAGQSIQAAVDNAQSGQVVCVRAGNYHEQIKIKEADAGITLMAYPGEKPVIDGRGVLPVATAKNKYMGLIHITGNDVTVDGFEVRDSAIRGIAVIQPPASAQPLQNVIVRNMTVHGSKDAGINVNGNDTVRPRNILIENNVVYDNLLKNSNGGAGGNGLTFIEVNNSTARGNVVYNNLGEGLVIGRWTDNITLEDNISYDNQHANLYIVNTANPTVRRNFVFCSDDRTYWSSKTPKKPSAGLQIRDENFENHSTPPPASTGHVIINNIVTGCSPNFGVSTQIHGGGLNNSLVANNTFANSRGDGGASINNVLFAGDANYANSRFVNNLMLQTGPGLNVNILHALGDPNLSTFTLTNNLYNQSVPKDWPASEPGRVIGDPKLSNPALPVKGSMPNPAGFGLQSGSPAINAGTAVGQVTDDFFKQPRNGAPDIGADEAGGGGGGGGGPTTGRIIVAKETSPQGATQTFSFTTSYAPGSFQLTDGQSHDSGELNPGNYSVAMTPVSGWQTTAACSDGSQPSSISLSAGEIVTCTFSSEQQSVPATRIIVIKQTIPANDPQSFMFASNFAGAFSLTHNGQKSADVEPGVYQVSETVPTGWVQDSATCSDGSAPTSINLSQGETVTCTFVNRKESTGGGDLNAIVYLATFEPGSVGGVEYNKGDIVTYDGQTGAWSMYFDGSDVGIVKPLNDFALMPDGSLLMVINGTNNLSGPGGSFKLLMQDVARFNPTSLGADTAGSWSLYFDGSDVGLSTSAEKIDSLALKSDGTVLISTYGKASVKNSNQTVIAMDEDLLAFAPTSTGDNTSGVWSLALDGSAISGLKSEDITALWHDNATGTHYVTVMSDFIVAGQSGNTGTILAIPATGAPFVFWNATDAGFTGPIDGLHLNLNP